MRPIELSGAKFDFFRISHLFFCLGAVEDVWAGISECGMSKNPVFAPDLFRVKLNHRGLFSVGE